MIRTLILASFALTLTSALSQPFHEAEDLRIQFGSGLFGTPNPSALVGLAAEENIIVVGDQDIAGGRDGKAHVLTNGMLSQTLTDNSTILSAGWFGHALAYSSNYLAVGSTHSASTNGSLEGDVQIFWRSNDNHFHFIQFIRPTNLTVIGDDEFGCTLDWDGQTLVVAAPWYDYEAVSDTDSGAVWFYTNSPSGQFVLQQGPVIGSTTTNHSFFGGRLAVQGTNCFVGGLVSGIGYCYWFTLDGGTWTQRGVITPDERRPGGEAFAAGALSVDYPFLLVGAPMNLSSVLSGGCYIFEHTDGGWVQRMVYIGDTGGRTLFANSGRIKGNVAVVGTRFADHNNEFNSIWQATNALGRAHVFRNSGGNWSLKQVLAPDWRQPGDMFAGDVFTDGATVLAVTHGARRSGVPTIILATFVTVPPPVIQFAQSDRQLILSWPTSAVGFTLAFSTNIFSTNWTPVLASPDVVDGNYVVTNEIVEPSGFYRLQQE